MPVAAYLPRVVALVTHLRQPPAPSRMARLIEQVYEVRGALEVLAVRLAAERRTVIDPAILVAGRAAVRRGHVKALIDADLAFHTAIYRAADNPLIEQSALLNWHHIRRAMGLALQSDQLRKPVWTEHQAIADAMARGDADQAEALVRTHTGKAGDTLARQLRQPPDQGHPAQPSGQLRGRRLPV